MGVISDAIDALQDWCIDLFKDGIKAQFTDHFPTNTGMYRIMNTKPVENT